ncbi:MAG: hypothetical protein RBU30_22310 [Polyangia bacterium]|jgi:hypothetical protein|nr:hypothetical protein [Polyangia bacterium]
MTARRMALETWALGTMALGLATWSGLGGCQAREGGKHESKPAETAEGPRDHMGSMGSPGPTSGVRPKRLGASADCVRAMRLAEKQLVESGKKAEDYKLIEAKNLVIKGGGQVAPHLWRLTFKPRSLLPEGNDGIIGAGGEIFLEADLKAGRARISGYGE